MSTDVGVCDCECHYDIPLATHPNGKCPCEPCMNCGQNIKPNDIGDHITNCVEEIGESESD